MEWFPTDVRVQTGSAAVQDSLAGGIEDKIAALLSGAGPLQPILDYLASTRGKRLRPHLVVWTSQACSDLSRTVPPLDDVLSVAAVFELVHMASLVHDDIIDGARMRRGMPTAHLLWGLHSAVLAGDYLFTRANRTALKYSDFGVASLVNQAIELTCEGEVAQDSRLFDCTLTAADYLSNISRKTAALFGAACQAGASLGGAPDDVEEAMLRFGIEVGCAFQIADDILDLTADPASSGKPCCSDLRSGVLTLPLIYALETPAKPLIEECFASRDFGESAVREVQRACESEGSLSRAKTDARRFAASALSRLAAIPACPGRTALEAVASAMAGEMA